MQEIFIAVLLCGRIHNLSSDYYSYLVYNTDVFEHSRNFENTLELIKSMKAFFFVSEVIWSHKRKYNSNYQCRIKKLH